MTLPFAPTTLFIVGTLFSQTIALGFQSPSLTKLLREGGASEQEAERVAHSRNSFARALPHIQDGEVALMGAVSIPVPLDFFVERFREVETFRKGPGVLGVGKIGYPARGADIENLHLDSKTLQTLRTCRLGKCGVKLSSEMMDTLRRLPDGHGRTSGFDSAFRELLFTYLKRYQEEGTAAMIAYADSDPPVESSKVFLALLGQFEWLKEYSPELYDVLRKSLPKDSSDVEQFFYWSKDDFGLKPVITMTHVLTSSGLLAGKRWMVAASKQIYADHYLEGSLGLTLAVDESPDAGHPAIVVAYVNRSQTDGLRGWLASIQRAIVERRARKGLADRLSQMKNELVQAYRGPRP